MNIFQIRATLLLFVFSNISLYFLCYIIHPKLLSSCDGGCIIEPCSINLTYSWRYLMWWLKCLWLAKTAEKYANRLCNDQKCRCTKMESLLNQDVTDMYLLQANVRPSSWPCIAKIIETFWTNNYVIMFPNFYLNVTGRASYIVT